VNARFQKVLGKGSDNMPSIRKLLNLLLFSALFAAQTESRSVQASLEPQAYVYREVSDQKLRAYVFLPTPRKATKPTSAILLFHGGGWVAGTPEWCFKDARRYAALGMVAIAVEYRLSQGNVTPIEALDDVRFAFRWVRQKAIELNIDPLRVAGNGVSAGGQLVTAAALSEGPGDITNSSLSKPNLLLLWSPALDVANDGWFKKLLQGRASASDYSPSERAGCSIPPTCIVHGEKDTLTPLLGVKRFCDRVLLSGGKCELNVYQGVGHLLTRNLVNQEDDFDPDPIACADGRGKQDSFLMGNGYLPAR